jgi:hypothetical protein
MKQKFVVILPGEVWDLLDRIDEKMIVMENNTLIIYTLDEAKDKHLGKVGTDKRDKYEYALRLDLLGEMIKLARKERHITQSPS